MFNVKHTTAMLGDVLGEVDKTLDQMSAELDKVFDNDLFKTAKETAEAILSFPGSFPSFPPVNLFAFRQTTFGEKNKEGSLNQYVVELALSGYKSDDVDVSVETINGVNFLTIESAGINERIGSNVKWYQRGIAGRAFKMKFMIASNVKVKSAKLEHGLLSINLTVENPLETKTVQKIDLNKGDK